MIMNLGKGSLLRTNDMEITINKTIF